MNVDGIDSNWDERLDLIDVFCSAVRRFRMERGEGAVGRWNGRTDLNYLAFSVRKM